MRLPGRPTILRAAVLLLAAAAPALSAAQVIEPSDVRPIDGQRGPGVLPNRVADDVYLSERLGERAVTDGAFQDERGRTVRLDSLLGHGRPVLLVFAYHSCPSLCSLVLDGVAEAVAETPDYAPGRDYELVVASVDPRDTPARADSVKARYVRSIGRPEVARGMHFWTVTPGTEASVKALAESVGFGYAYDAASGEYAHTAALTLLSPAGIVTRYLYGIAYAPRDVRLGLVEAGEGRIGTALDRFLLTCYDFDHNSRSYSVAVLGVLKVLGGLMLVLFVGVVGGFWRREVRRQRDALDGSEENVNGGPPAIRTASAHGSTDTPGVGPPAGLSDDSPSDPPAGLPPAS